MKNYKKIIALILVVSELLTVKYQDLVVSLILS